MSEEPASERRLHFTESRDGETGREAARARHLSDRAGKTKRERKGRPPLLSSSDSSTPDSQCVVLLPGLPRAPPAVILPPAPGSPPPLPNRLASARTDLHGHSTVAFPGCFSQTGSCGLHCPNGIMVVTTREPAGEGLPDGWLKEYRPRKARPGTRARRDKFYIDPTNSYEFRSLKEVHHYLESRDTSNRVVTSNKRKIEDLQVSGNQSQHAGRPSSEPKGVSKGKLAKLELQMARENDQRLKHESAAREEANVGPKLKGKKQKTEPVKQISAPVRSSPRLTALKRNEEANNVPRDPLVGAQTDMADQVEPTEQVENPKSKAISSPVIQNKDGAHATSTSGNGEDKHPSAPEQILGASAACSLTDVGRQNAHALPQQNGLVGTADAMPGYSLSSLFRSIWSDPCLEFAFRTLTGDIPVLDNNLAVANNFLPPQVLNKGTTAPNCSSSTYDGARKNHGQVDRVRLPMPMPRPSDKLYSSGWFPPQ